MHPSTLTSVTAFSECVRKYSVVCTNREAVIELDAPPPILVVEVVSPSTQTTDYRHKRSEYAVLGIQEYWLVDPVGEKVAILTLVSGFYDQVVFQGDEAIESGIFPELSLTANQVLSSS